MREIPRAPSCFSGTVDELYEKHVKPVLIDTGPLQAFHAALMNYLKTDDPVFLVRQVRDMERGEVVRSDRGHLIKGSDNAPPWYIHKHLYSQPFCRTRDFSDFLATAWCHFHDTRPHRPHINSQGWYVAHIFRAKDGNTAFHDWDRKELTKRMVRSIHPCNYFYVPLTDGRAYGEDPAVIAYFRDTFSRLYGEVWEEFLVAADASAMPKSSMAASFEYTFGTTEPDSGPDAPPLTGRRGGFGPSASRCRRHETDLDDE